jgi:putative transposon-encoded protein
VGVVAKDDVLNIALKPTYIVVTIFANSAKILLPATGALTWF